MMAFNCKSKFFPVEKYFPFNAAEPIVKLAAPEFLTLEIR